MEETRAVCQFCGELNCFHDQEQKWNCDSCNNQNYVSPSFKTFWINDFFDKCEYYALIADLNRWGTDYPMEYISEPALGILEEKKGIVFYKTALYVYSNYDLAESRAEAFGGGVETFKIECLSCFISRVSDNLQFADVILDERWHLDIFTCRDSHYTRVTHIILNDKGEMFQLVGCSSNGNLNWQPTIPISNSNHPTVACRPVSFPTGSTITLDHRVQGGTVDMDFLAPGATYSMNEIAGEEFILGPEGLYARPVKELAFVPTMGQSIILTRGNGIWIPLGQPLKGASLFPWAKTYKGYFDLIFTEKDAFNEIQIDRGADWYLNEAFFLLEVIFQDEEHVDEKKRLEELNGFINSALKVEPGSFVAQEIKNAMDNWPFEKLKALIHADRIPLALTRASFEMAKAEYENALNINQNCILGHYNMAHAHWSQQDLENTKNLFLEILKINPEHSRAIFFLAVLDGRTGNEKKEIEGYLKSAKIDPFYAEPLYNLAITYNDRGEVHKAVESYQATLERDPLHLKARENLSLIYFDNNNMEEAHKLMRSAINLDMYRDQTYHSYFGMVLEHGPEDMLDTIWTAWNVNVPNSELRKNFQAEESDE